MSWIGAKQARAWTAEARIALGRCGAGTPSIAGLLLAAKPHHPYREEMDQTPAPDPLPEGWTESIARSEADLAAGRATTIDTDALCREIEAEAEAMERRVVARQASPA
jgi:hypothetical protein